MWGIRAARLFDGERFVDRPTVLVDDGEVVAVGEPVPESAPVVELGEDTLLPGFVDCHQHLVFDGHGTLEGQVSGIADDVLVERARTAARRALSGGVTTLRDLGDRGFLTLGLRGDRHLPTVAAAGPPITPPGGHCWYLGGETEGEPALRQAVAERIERGCDVVKIMVTGGAMTPSFPLWQNQFTRPEVQLVVDEAHRSGRPVAAHCHGIDGISLAIDVGVDSIEHCSFFTDALECAPPPELLERLAASDVAVSATWGLTAEPARPPHWDVAFPLIRAASGEVHRAGGHVVVGTDAGIYPQKPHDVLPHSLPTMLEAGMSTVDALR
ncbi:MAG: amidohydrolase family protein, partial [Ilumatobacteraceae bacterium]